MDEKDLKITALEQEIKDLKNLINHIPAHIYWKNKEGFVEGCNSAQAKTLGFDNPEDVIGKSMYDLFTKEIAEKIITIDCDVIENGQQTITEEYAPSSHRGDLTTYLSMKVPLRDERDQVKGLLGLSIDIGNYKLVEFQLKKSHEEIAQKNRLVNVFLENILSYAPISFYWLDKKYRILGCNTMQAKLFGLPDSTDLIGKNIYDIVEQCGFDSETIRRMQKGNLSILSSGMPHQLEERIFSNGQQRIFLTYKNPLFDEQKNIIGIFGFSFEVTEQKNAAELLTKTNTELERLNQAKTEFIRNMEHDIRTPLAGIQMLSHELSQFEPQHQANISDFLNQISNSAKGLIDYCNCILDFSRVESDSLATTAREVSLRELLEKTLHIQQPSAISQQLNLRIAIDPHLPDRIILDDYRVHRILVNLVSNAIKFTETGEIVFGVKSFHPTTHHNGILTFYVKDTGIGIPSDKIDYIFERFSRLSPANQNRFSGQGLGLSIVKKFTDDLKGRISVSSELGKGSIFEVTVPVALTAE